MNRHRGQLARTCAVIVLFLTLSQPARAAGFTDAITSPIQSIAVAIESAFSDLVAAIEPHHPVAVRISPATWHATGTSATAAAFNAVAPTIPAPQPQPLADAHECLARELQERIDHDAPLLAPE